VPIEPEPSSIEPEPSSIEPEPSSIELVEIRLATYDDRRAVARMRREWTEEDAESALEDDSFEARFDAWLEREQHQRLTWLGLLAGEPVAMLNVLVFTRMPRPGREPSRWGYLANFYVAPELRGSGLGTRMLDVCTSYADSHEFVRIVLSPSDRSVPFYARAGFVPASSLMVRTP
jgi:GNAT superfamily N-acetyltransferase